MTTWTPEYKHPIDYLLAEEGDYILAEEGGFIVLEDTGTSSALWTLQTKS